MKIVLDRQDPTPVYRQLVNAVAEVINRGQLPVGHRLPSVRSMAGQLRVNLNTVARAYRVLDALGLLDVQHGRGAIVASSRRICDAPQRKELRKLATRLVNDAVLLGCEPEQLHALIDSELAALQQQTRL